jgi:hypothetical protein
MIDAVIGDMASANPVVLVHSAKRMNGERRIQVEGAEQEEAGADEDHAGGDRLVGAETRAQSGCQWRDQDHEGRVREQPDGGAERRVATYELQVLRDENITPNIDMKIRTMPPVPVLNAGFLKYRMSSMGSRV